MGAEPCARVCDHFPRCCSNILFMCVLFHLRVGRQVSLFAGTLHSMTDTHYRVTRLAATADAGVTSHEL